MVEFSPIVLYSLSFFLVALAARQIGKYFSQYGLPYITGYLLAGAIAGPFILEMLPDGAVDELRYIDDISLAIIAFIAGSELYLKELRSRLRAILLNAAGIVVAAFILLSVAIFILQSFIPFAEEYSTMLRVAVALMGATILLALSPASTIAVIQEVRAKGPFSKTVLSITVVMDVVIIVMFAVSVAIAGAIIEEDTISAGFVGILAIDIAIALGAGYLVGQLIAQILRLNLLVVAKALALMAIGFVIFEASLHFPDWSDEALGVKLKIEPLLIAMVAGFTVTNFTSQRLVFEDLLHRISPMVYVAFFALTGVGLKLDILFETLGIALILFLVRMVAIIIGTYAGGTIAGESVLFRRWAGLGLITQAGIALGLARETAVEFPDTLGGEFATLIIAVVVLNEVFGPLLLKFALRQTGEAQIPLEGRGTKHHIVILGVEQQSLALARQLTSEGWEVVVADTDAERVAQLADDHVDERHIPDVSEETMQTLVNGRLDALVAMLDDDEQSLMACNFARDRYNTNRIVVRLTDLRLAESFRTLGARIIDPASSMVSLLHQSVRAPEVVDLLLEQDPDHQVVQVEIKERAVDGMVLRDLRLPSDVLVLEIRRAQQPIVPHGFTTLRRGDEVVLLGSPDSLQEVFFKLGD